MSLTITVLGASGSYPAPGTACSGYLLRTATTSVWLDCGSGSLANLQRHVPLADLDGIVCSHSHPDHWVDLPLADVALRYYLDAGEAQIPLLWTAETAQHFASVAVRHPGRALDARVIDQSVTATIGDIDLRFSRTDHPVETLAVRADAGGRSIVYSADTGNRWDLRSLGPDIDLAVIEATLDEDEADRVQHLTARQAGVKAAEAGVAALVLTHLAPGSDPEARRAAAAAAFDGPVEIARIDERY